MNDRPTQTTEVPDPKDAAIAALEDRVHELEIEAEYAWSLVQSYKCQEQKPTQTTADFTEEQRDERIEEVARRMSSSGTPI